jgi:hypothetical protein
MSVSEIINNILVKCKPRDVVDLFEVLLNMTSLSGQPIQLGARARVYLRYDPLSKASVEQAFEMALPAVHLIHGYIRINRQIRSDAYIVTKEVLIWAMDIIRWDYLRSY